MNERCSGELGPGGNYGCCGQLMDPGDGSRLLLVKGLVQMTGADL